MNKITRSSSELLNQIYVKMISIFWLTRTKNLLNFAVVTSFTRIKSIANICDAICYVCARIKQKNNTHIEREINLNAKIKKEIAQQIQVVHACARAHVSFSMNRRNINVEP